MTPKPLFDLVIFDNDGVLVDSEEIAARVLADALTDDGVQDLSPQRCRELFLGRSMTSIAETLLGRGHRLTPGFETSYGKALAHAFETELRATPGIHDALAAIDVPVAVASSSTRPRVERSLDIVGLLDRFRGQIVTIDDVRRGKPAPDLFLEAARRRDIAPRRCAVVEDSPLGVDAGNAAGMVTFGYVASTPPASMRHATGHLLADLRRLPELLDTPRGPR